MSTTEKVTQSQVLRIERIIYINHWQGKERQHEIGLIMKDSWE